MSKFNQPTKNINVTQNKAGGRAYLIPDAKLKLVLMVFTALVGEPKYYGNTDKEMLTLIRQLLDTDAKFIANLTIYTRKEMYLRSITHVLLCEMAKHPNGKPFVRETLRQVVERVDDMTEILANYIKVYGKPIPNSIKKGISDILTSGKFDEYGYAKYNRDGQVKLKDLLQICHPTPKDENQNNLFKKILEDRLEIPETWETVLSKDDGRTKKEKWHQLIEKRSLGYMSTLRNLRNIVSNCDVEYITKALQYITNENAIKNSKQLPHRYLSAYRELSSLDTVGSKVLDAIETALEISTQNLPTFAGTTFIVADNSGSMDDSLSKMSKVTYKDVAMLLSAVSHKFCENAITSVFAEHFKVVTVSTKNGILSNMERFININVGYKTYLYKALEWLVDNVVVVDRIMVFSDMQCYSDNYYAPSVQSLLDKYRRTVNPNVILHSIDLAGHGTSVFYQDKKINLIGGWNDRVLEFMFACEQETDKIIDKVCNYYF